MERWCRCKDLDEEPSSAMDSYLFIRTLYLYARYHTWSQVRTRSKHETISINLCLCPALWNTGQIPPSSPPRTLPPARDRSPSCGRVPSGARTAPLRMSWRRSSPPMAVDPRVPRSPRRSWHPMAVARWGRRRARSAPAQDSWGGKEEMEEEGGGRGGGILGVVTGVSEFLEVV